MPEIAGTISNQSYFMTLDTPANNAFVEAFQTKFGADKRINAISEATYYAIYLYARAVEEAGSTEVSRCGVGNRRVRRSSGKEESTRTSTC